MNGVRTQVHSTAERDCFVETEMVFTVSLIQQRTLKCNNSQDILSKAHNGCYTSVSLVMTLLT